MYRTMELYNSRSTKTKHKLFLSNTVCDFQSHLKPNLDPRLTY